MKTTGIPADASTLIYLAKADAFAPASKCIGPLGVPPSVWREAAEAWEDRDADEVARMRLAERDGFLRRIALAEKVKRRAGSLASQHLLGAGESEVLALGVAGGQVVLDEDRATAVAEEMGLLPIRTIRIPLLGAARGLLSGSAAVAMFRRLAAISNTRSDVVVELEHLLRGYMR